MGWVTKTPRLVVILLLLLGGGLAIRWVSARASQQKQTVAVCEAVEEAQ